MAETFEKSIQNGAISIHFFVKWQISLWVTFQAFYLYGKTSSFCSQHHTLKSTTVWMFSLVVWWSLRGGRKKGRGRGRGKRAKEGKSKGSACYKSRCFCIPPTIFWTNPIKSTVNMRPVTSRALLSKVRTWLLCLLAIVKSRRFFQVMS